MTDPVERVDVLVAGGGYVGLSAALAIAASVPGARVALADPRPWRDASGDLRAFAVAAAGRRMLSALGVWDGLVGEAEPIREMKLRGHYEKPSEKKAREKAEAVRRSRKLARKRAQREGLGSVKGRTH